MLGGGVIGVEFASAWKSFGSEVRRSSRASSTWSRRGREQLQVLERAFRKRGISPDLGTFFQKAEYTQDGVKVTLADGKEFEAEVLLVAIGRGPVSQGLGYEENGVAMDRGFVLVDEYMRTNVPTISAVGYLLLTLQLAHVGFAEGILACAAARRPEDRAGRLRRRAAGRRTATRRSPPSVSPRPRRKEVYGAGQVENGAGVVRHVTSSMHVRHAGLQ
ncbi:dihydrolipoyl dehydrogenase [Streptomyces violaceorubidus]